MSSPMGGSPTPGNGQRLSQLKRSSTLPSKLMPTPRQPSGSSSGPSETIETLYTTNGAKVVSFSASPPSRRNSIVGRDGVDDERDAGTLPWASSTERTMAAGPLRIYRVPNSVSFINSGNFLHPVLPRTQCWCVDGESKFVIPTRERTFYRIELPNHQAEEKEKVEEFKTVLDGVLRYEKTQCPFERGFHVELPPEPPKTPVRRRPQPTGRAKRWTLHRHSWTPEDSFDINALANNSSETSISSVSGEDRDRESIRTSSPAGALKLQEAHGEAPLRPDSPVEPAQITLKQPPSPPSKNRSVTAPAQLDLKASAPSQPSVAAGGLAEDLPDNASIASTDDSFYSFSDASSTLAHSPPSQYAPDEELPTPRPVKHSRDISAVTVTSPDSLEVRVSSRHSEDSQGLSTPSTPTLIEDVDDAHDPPWSDAVTPPDSLRLRSLNQARHRKPIPPSFFRSPNKSPSRQLTSAIIQKTYAILIGPPAHLVALMLRIASRFTAGARSFGPVHGRKGERVPGSWYSSGDEEDMWDDEDDFGIPLSTMPSKVSSTRSRSPASDSSSSQSEVD